MRSHYTLLFALFLLLLAVPDARAGESKIVIRVISGDTIVVDGGQVVRLLGVIAPSRDEYYAKESRQFTTAQLLGLEVNVEVDSQNALSGHKDSYGRKLAYVYRASDDLFINAVLIERGYGFVSSMNNLKFTPQFQTFQLGARRSKLGVWAKTDMTPQERARAENRTYEEPGFEHRSEFKYPDIRVEILWAKRADPRFRVARSSEEAKFLELLYQDELVSKGIVPMLVKLRQNLAQELTKFYRDKNVALHVETTGEAAEVLRFIAEGMDQEVADKFCSIEFNRELFSGLEFTEVIFTDNQKFSFTYKVAQ
jgi:endonuclease YncB( thermonuclease family)